MVTGELDSTGGSPESITPEELVWASEVLGLQTPSELVLALIHNPRAEPVNGSAPEVVDARVISQAYLYFNDAMRAANAVHRAGAVLREFTGNRSVPKKVVAELARHVSTYALGGNRINYKE